MNIEGQVRSNNGANFVGAEQELINTFFEVNHTKIKGFLQKNSADWIKWKINTPAASHMNDIWEHQACLARSIQESLLQIHDHNLDEESLETLMADTEEVINS